MNDSVKTRHHVARVVRFDPRELKAAIGEVEGFNAKVAVLITKGVGTMACAYVFCLVALVSLPDVLIQAGALPVSTVPHLLANPGLILIVAWVAQTFIQLVLLSIIMVGQQVQQAATDAQSAKQFADTETILDLMSTTTQGGLKTILDAVEANRAS